MSYAGTSPVTQYYYQGEQISSVDQPCQQTSFTLVGQDRIITLPLNISKQTCIDSSCRQDKKPMYYFSNGKSLNMLLHNPWLTAQTHQNSIVTADKTRDYQGYGPNTQFSMHFGYNGEYQGLITQLIYLRARDYSPNYQRFITMDSYFLWNRYNFADANPIMNVDPSGHIPLAEAGLATLLVGSIFASIHGGIKHNWTEMISGLTSLYSFGSLGLMLDIWHHSNNLNESFKLFDKAEVNGQVTDSVAASDIKENAASDNLGSNIFMQSQYFGNDDRYFLDDVGTKFTYGRISKDPLFWGRLTPTHSEAAFLLNIEGNSYYLSITGELGYEPILEYVGRPIVVANSFALRETEGFIFSDVTTKSANPLSMIFALKNAITFGRRPYSMLRNNCHDFANRILDGLNSLAV